MATLSESRRLNKSSFKPEEVRRSGTESYFRSLDNALVCFRRAMISFR